MSAHEDEQLTALSDALLMRRFREGDEASFEALFNRHYDMVYGVLFRLTGTRQEAEDLAQEVFLKLYRKPLWREENVAGWLYRVALNMGYNALRTAIRRERREQTAGRAADSPPCPEDEVSLRETQRRVREALAKLPDREAWLLVLREMGFSYRELADIVGVKPGSVGTLLVRAQRAFRAAYGQEEQDGSTAST